MPGLSDVGRPGSRADVVLRFLSVQAFAGQSRFGGKRGRAQHLTADLVLGKKIP